MTSGRVLAELHDEVPAAGCQLQAGSAATPSGGQEVAAIMLAQDPAGLD